MLDDLRQQANLTYGEEAPTIEKPLKPRGKRFLGMTPVQRLVIAVLLFFITTLIGSLCLLVNGIIVLPI
ncbi:MAG: hypothetical protein JW908_12965 [Anaerolineales bacterium]|nr:hypothetical protein [Anaerolineales bacterium]